MWRTKQIQGFFWITLQCVWWDLSISLSGYFRCKSHGSGRLKTKAACPSLHGFIKCSTQQTQHVSVINSCKNITAVVSPTFLPASVSFLAPGNLKKRQTPFILNNKLDNTSTLCVSTYQSTWLCRLICDTSACLFIKSLVCVCMCVLACKKKADCAHVLPPLSEQKVISQPSPDENALSISLNTLPGKKTLVRIGWGINSNNRKTLHRLYFTESLARLLANTKLAHLSVVAGCSSPCQSWVMVVVMNCMEKWTRLSLLRSPLNFSGLYRNAKNW